MKEYDSCLHNCFIKRNEQDKRDDKTIFEQVGPDIICRLDGYAIIPIEEYNGLIGKDMLEI